jgi:hypothetical protein
MNIKDRQLSTAYTALQNQRKSDPTVKVDDKTIVALLAGAGDSGAKTAAKLTTLLSAPGMTRQAQFDAVKNGVSANEKTDLKTILDSGDVPLTPSAKNFLEALVGRATLDGGQPPLSFNFDNKTGVAGTLAAGVSVEAINVTTAPGGRLHMDDTVEIGKSDSFGKFMGNAATADFMKDAQEGDQIRFRTRDASGTVGDWQTTTVHHAGQTDTRNAVVALFRVGVTDAGAGKVALTNINDSRQISEPGAKLQFTNTRTGEKTVVTLNDKGTFAADLKLNGKAGDVFNVAATDGKNNTTFSASAGTVAVPGATGTTTGGKVDLPDPKLHKDEMNADGTPKFTTQRYEGPLFTNGVEMGDVVQGQLGDCYVPSAFAAMAKANPDFLKNAIKDNGDGTYTVTFKKRDWSSGTMVPVEVKVDGDLYSRSWGGPLYGASSGDRSTSKMEMWFPIMEKAYAAFKGGAEGYNGIGNGGASNDVFEAITGLRGSSSSISTSSSPTTVFAQVKSAIDNHLPISAGTHGDDQEALYTNTGVYADHSYSVVGYKEEGGVKYVQLRNPWGESEPAGDGKNDGVFFLPMDKFLKLYETVMTVQSH